MPAVPKAIVASSRSYAWLASKMSMGPVLYGFVLMLVAAVVIQPTWGIMEELNPGEFVLIKTGKSCESYDGQCVNH